MHILQLPLQYKPAVPAQLIAHARLRCSACVTCKRAACSMQAAKQGDTSLHDHNCAQVRKLKHLLTICAAASSAAGASVLLACWQQAAWPCMCARLMRFSANVCLRTLLHNAQTQTCSNLPCSASPARHCTSTAIQSAPCAPQLPHATASRRLCLHCQVMANAQLQRNPHNLTQHAATHMLQRGPAPGQQACHHRVRYVAASPSLCLACAAPLITCLQRTCA